MKTVVDGMQIPLSPSLAMAIGLNEAIVLQQIHYLMLIPVYGKTMDGKRWIYNSLPEWQRTYFPFWSESTVKRVLNSLREKGIVVCGNFNVENFDRTLWYTIDYDALGAIVTHAESEKREEDDAAPSGQFELTNTIEAIKLAKDRDKLKLISAADDETSARMSDKKPSSELTQAGKAGEEETSNAFTPALFPNSKEGSSKRRVKKQDPVLDLLETFKEVTGLEIPHAITGSAYNKLWRTPLHEIYVQLCEENMVAAKSLLADVCRHMIESELTMHNPNSIIRTARSMRARQKLDRKQSVEGDAKEGFWM